ncbi:MAG: ABC transporter ATP-binding protein [Chloroflexi bacterium]|nr:ABC transporter ATP-binding protein [Chloroflexota bacterium]
MNAAQSLYLSKNYFTSGDPLTYILKRRLRLNPLVGMLGSILAINLPIILIAFTNDLLMDRNGTGGLLNDYGWWALQLTSLPATIFYFLWAPDGIRAVLRKLIANRVITLPSGDESAENGYADFMRRFDQNYSRGVWALLSLVGAFVFVAFMVPVYRTFKYWAVLNTFAFWYIQFFWFVLAFLVCLLVLRSVIVILWFNRLFQEFPVNIKPLHKDGAGGLAPLGNFSVKIGYLVSIYGIASAVTVLTQSYLATGQLGTVILNPPLVMMLGAYLILSPLVFFAPISIAHAAMDRAKHALVSRIANQFESDLAALHAALDTNAEELKQRLDKIEQLQRVHKLVMRFPAWPFNTDNLIHFLSSVLSPVAIAIIPAVINLIVRLTAQ